MHASPMTPTIDLDKYLRKSSIKDVYIDHAILMEAGPFSSCKTQIALLTDAIGLFPEDVALLRSLAKALRRALKLEDAKQVLQRALAIYPENAGLYCDYADIELCCEEWEKALATLLSIPKNAKNDPQYTTLLTTVCGGLGDFTQAEKAIKNALRAHPNDVHRHCEHIQIMMRQGKWEKAVELAGAAAKRFPEEISPHILCAEANEQISAFDAAIFYILKALKIRPSNADLKTLAQIALRLQSWSIAEAICIRLIRQEPHSAAHYAKLLELYIITREFDKAEALFSSISCSLPQLPKYRQMLKGIQNEINSAKSQATSKINKNTAPPLPLTHRALPWVSFTDNESQNYNTVEYCDPNDDFLEKKIIVYSCMLNNYDILVDPLAIDERVEYILFTDSTDFKSDTWNIIHFNDELKNPRRSSRLPKILPHRYLPPHDISIYLDSSLVLTEPDIYKMAFNCLGESDIALYSHYTRKCVYEEIDHLARNSERMNNLYQAKDAFDLYKKAGYPENAGLHENAFIIRKNTESIRNLNETWWNLYNAGSPRDQLTFSYCAWRLGTKVNTIKFGKEFRKTPFMLLCAHDYMPYPEQSKNRELVSNSGKSSKSKCTVDFSVNRVNKAAQLLPLVWGYHENHRHIASTVMRGKQLSSIASQLLAKWVSVKYLPSLDLINCSDSVIILTKGLLSEATPEFIQRLTGRNNVVLADFVDDPIRDELNDMLDGYIASSVKQYNHLLYKYPQKNIFHITHHVDPLIRDTHGPKDYCNIGYYGELICARYAKQLIGIIDFCQIHTDGRKNRTYLNRLRHSNVHYAVRNDLPIKGFKPFLKGFTAAHCGANIIVQHDESDAMHYLGKDYPYMIYDTSLAKVKETIEYVHDSFGSKEWYYGLEIMESVREKSTQEYVANEVLLMLKRLSE